MSLYIFLQRSQRTISPFSSRAEILTLIEDVVTYIFQFMSQSLYSAEYTIARNRGEGGGLHVFARGRFCLQTHASANRRPCQVVPFSFWQQLFEHLTSALKYVLDQRTVVNRGNRSRSCETKMRHSRSLNIDNEPGSKFSATVYCTWESSLRQKHSILLRNKSNFLHSVVLRHMFYIIAKKKKKGKITYIWLFYKENFTNSYFLNSEFKIRQVYDITLSNN